MLHDALLHREELGMCCIMQQCVVKLHGRIQNNPSGGKEKPLGIKETSAHLTNCCLVQQQKGGNCHLLNNCSGLLLIIWLVLLIKLT